MLGPFLVSVRGGGDKETGGAILRKAAAAIAREHAEIMPAGTGKMSRSGGGKEQWLCLSSSASVASSLSMSRCCDVQLNARCVFVYVCV